jgi:glycerol-3-phosphate dehydrogenase
MVAALRDREFDVLVVGGGITGCGIALDAVTRGLSTALVERDDFAPGTSSKSSSSFTAACGTCNRATYGSIPASPPRTPATAPQRPHLVAVLPFLVPILTKDGPVSKKIAKAMRSALWMYDLTGGARIGKLHRRLDADESLAHCPSLPVERLSSGFVYYDAATDDARLTLAVARTAAQHGAIVANRCAVRELTRG